MILGVPILKHFRVSTLVYISDKKISVSEAAEEISEQDQDRPGLSAVDESYVKDKIQKKKKKKKLGNTCLLFSIDTWFYGRFTLPELPQICKSVMRLSIKIRVSLQNTPRNQDLS